METNPAYFIRSTDEEGSAYINHFEVKPIDGKLSYVASGSDSRVGATYWEPRNARAIVAFLSAYNPDRVYDLIPVL